MPAKQEPNSAFAIVMPLEPQVADELLHTVNQILNGMDNKVVRKRLATVLTRISEDSIDLYVNDIVDRLDLNRMAQSSVDMGVMTCRKGFGIMINGMIRLLSRQQLEIVAEFMLETVISELEY